MNSTQQFKLILTSFGKFALVVAFAIPMQPSLKFAQAVGPSPQPTLSAQTPPRTSGKIPWWKDPDPGSHYVTDKQGRTILSVCRIDEPHPHRPKRGIRHLKRLDMKPNDHRGHGCPENLVDNPDRVNTQYNITAQSPDTNLGVKREIEELAKRIKVENPNSKIYFVTEYLYKGEGKRPVAETHSIMNDKGEIFHEQTIFNKSKEERHTTPDRGGTSYFREKVEASNSSTSPSKASSSSTQTSQVKLFDTAKGGETRDTGVLDKVLFGNDKPVPSNKAAKSTLGGIDFSTLELRYLADSNSMLGDRGLRYAFTAAPATTNKNLNAGRKAAVQASDAFSVWLALTPDKFWVNLNPDEPDRIIDSQLAKTDAGRIMLQADLQMKKTTARLIHPDTSLGKQYWQQLGNINNSQGCLAFRQWIVPAPATIREDGDGIYIQDAPLQVKLESQSFQSNGVSGMRAFCSPQNQSIQTRNESLLRRLILPRIEQAVNEAPEYAELRRVYRSRVAAEWYRQRNKSQIATYRDVVKHNDISSLPAHQDWSPRQVFNQYVNSIKKGEFHVVHERREGNMIYTKTYIYGGVNFTNVFFKKLNSTDFQEQWSDLPQVVDASMVSPVADQHGKIWLGGSTTTLDSKSIWKSSWFYLILVVLVVLFLIYRKRLHGNVGSN